LVETDAEGYVRHHVEALEALGQAHRGPREGYLGDIDGEPRPCDVVQDGPVARGVHGRQHHGDARALPGDEARQVDHGEHVALRH